MKERDEFIDFIKGICIILVVTEHYLFFKIGLERDSMLWPFWGKCAVPLFLCIQSYLVFKKEKMNLKQDTIKMLKSIALPYIIAETIQIAIIYILRGWNAKELITEAIKHNGIGLGTYYFWIYLQFFIITRIVKSIENKLELGMHKWALITIMLSLVNAAICNGLDVSEQNYTINSLQYIFLIWIGLAITKWGWKPKGNLIVCGIGIVSIIIFNYNPELMKPWAHITEGAKDRQWSSYLYHTFFFGGIVLSALYGATTETIRNIICKVGQNSWSIFCVQMLWFTLIPCIKPTWLYVTITLLVCIYLPTKLREKNKKISLLRNEGETP